MSAQVNRLAQVMIAVGKRMRAEFEASEVIRHAGTKGSWRERTVHDFLRTYLPWSYPGRARRRDRGSLR